MRFFLGLLALCLSTTLAQAQSNVIVNYKNSATAPATQVSPTNPLPVTPIAGGTPQSVNITQVLGATISATNPVPTSQAPSAAAGSGVAPTPVAASQALAANQVIKASAGNLYSFQVSADSTLSAAAWWIMIYNATSAPIDGAVTPLKCYAMPAGATSYSAAFPMPIYLSTGITIGVSTNGCFTKAASTHAFISGDAQ